MSDVSKEFIAAVVNGCETHTYVQCSFCKKIHARDPKHGGSYKESEFEELDKNNLVIHDEPVQYGILDNGVFIPKCDCNGGYHYEQFLLRDRKLISRYYSAISLSLSETLGDINSIVRNTSL